MNEGIHLDLDTWIVPGQIRKLFGVSGLLLLSHTYTRMAGLTLEVRLPHGECFFGSWPSAHLTHCLTRVTIFPLTKVLHAIPLPTMASAVCLY